MSKEIYLAWIVFFPFAAGILVYGAGIFSRYRSGRANLESGKKNSGDSFADKMESGKKNPGDILAEKMESRGRNNRSHSQGVLRDVLAIGAVVAEWIVMTAMALSVLNGGSGTGEAALFLEIPEICGMGLHFELDGFRAIYGCVAAFMWMMATTLSREYFVHHQNRNRYYLFLLWTLGATMGVFLSADLYTTFLFFEVMSFTSYVWVAQEESKTALCAAETYLAVAVTGGLVLLMGLFLLYHQLETLTIRDLSAAAAGCSDRNVLYAAGFCMLFGFGAKAGAFPLHIWLPKAHPVAPAPASALLSGILTKTGVYGILILSCRLFVRDEVWGSLVLLIGVVTMLGGAVLAVFSVDLKRTLACSSMSQIGFILVGIGMLVLPEAGSLTGAGELAAGRLTGGSAVMGGLMEGTAVTGSLTEGLAAAAGSLGEGAAQAATAAHSMLAARGILLHMVNHSLIKLVLFLAAGVIFMNAHALNLNDIRGFGRKKPLLMGIFLTGACAISGIPFFGGYVSKTLLHESITAYGGGTVMNIVEALFLFSGGLTVAYMAKLFVAIFVEKNADIRRQESYDAMKSYMNPGTVFALTGSAVVLLVWGLFPHAVMERAAEKMQAFLGMVEAGEAVAYFSLENLQGGLISIVTGVVVYLLFIRKCLLRRTEAEGPQNDCERESDSRHYVTKGQAWDAIQKPVHSCGYEYVNAWPEWLDLEELIYRPLLQKVLPTLAGILCRILDSCVDLTVVALRKTIYRDSRLPREQTEGNALTETLGKILNAVQRLGNCTWKRRNPGYRDYVHLMAVKSEEIAETNHIIRRSLSFGLLLVCIGLSLTLFYLIWW